jgi:hypothetical protein
VLRRLSVHGVAVAPGPKRTEAFLADIRAHMRSTGDNYTKAMDAVYKAKGDTYEATEGFCGLSGAPQ